MAEPKDTIALVTGASTGIGFELARCFARDGHGLIVVAEEEEALQRAATTLRHAGSPRVEAVVADLSRPEGPDQVHEAAQRIGVLPEFLVNNAGIGVFGDFARETRWEDELRLIQLNVVSVVRLTKLFAASMVARGSGRILITSSVAAIAPSPLQSVYSASKAFEYAFAEGIANELADTGVTVTALLPDATETEFFARADMEDTKLGRASKADPAEIARAGYDAMMKGKDHVIAPFSAKLKAALTAVMPERVIASTARAD
ncbi:SDR family NAD(P)-dependent oxidoreductase [Inquilinus limosus]|uniref:SDR family NAD(P)-dependent oxidoreductase n=1 Tax=Inquilinus limosus TaxID=171674 RepID=UPI000478A1FE|nr:SDR family NAD(P)-dependent oxidoreductase [Inquilinus limosus]